MISKAERQYDFVVSRTLTENVGWARSISRPVNKRIADSTRAKRPQLPCWCREHRSGRPRSKDRRRPQLCAKPPPHRLAAQRPSASFWVLLVLHGQSGRTSSPGVAGQRIWLACEAPGHSGRARQGARNSALSRASALRPRAAASEPASVEALSHCRLASVALGGAVWVHV